MLVAMMTVVEAMITTIWQWSWWSVTLSSHWWQTKVIKHLPWVKNSIDHLNPSSEIHWGTCSSLHRLENTDYGTEPRSNSKPMLFIPQNTFLSTDSWDFPLIFQRKKKIGMRVRNMKSFFYVHFFKYVSLFMSLTSTIPFDHWDFPLCFLRSGK